MGGSEKFQKPAYVTYECPLLNIIVFLQNRGLLFSGRQMSDDVRNNIGSVVVSIKKHFLIDRVNVCICTKVII